MNCERQLLIDVDRDWQTALLARVYCMTGLACHGRTDLDCSCMRASQSGNAVTGWSSAVIYHQPLVVSVKYYNEVYVAWLTKSSLSSMGVC